MVGCGWVVMKFSAMLVMLKDQLWRERNEAIDRIQ